MHYKTRSTIVLSLKERTDVGTKTGNYFKTKGTCCSQDRISAGKPWRGSTR